MDLKNTKETDVDIFSNFFNKAMDAATHGHRSWSSQSTKEQVAVAVVLNKAKWLEAMGYTLADAVTAMERDWITAMPLIIGRLEKELGRTADRLGVIPRKSGVSQNQRSLFEDEDVMDPSMKH
jgi:hypothetical protein